jgi:ketosteroid isomerase-like protein
MSAVAFASASSAALFAAIDRKDAAGFVAFLTENASFRFGSSPVVKGRVQIAASVAAFFRSIKSCSHVVEKTISDGHTLMCEGMVTYTRLDDSIVAIPFVDVFELTDGLVSDYKIYIDISPLFSD